VTCPAGGAARAACDAVVHAGPRVFVIRSIGTRPSPVHSAGFRKIDSTFYYCSLVPVEDPWRHSLLSGVRLCTSVWCLHVERPPPRMSSSP
jgi:hypothetical protein